MEIDFSGNSTSNPDHLSLVSLIALDEWGCQRGSEIGDSRRHGPNDGDVTAICEFRELGIIVLEDAEGQWEACIVSGLGR